MDIQDYKRKFEAKFNLSINSTDWHTHFGACVQEEKQHSKSVLEKRISTATAMRQAYDRFVSWYIDAPGLRMCKEPVNWDTVYLLLNAAAGYGYCVTLAMFQFEKRPVGVIKLVDDTDLTTFNGRLHNASDVDDKCDGYKSLGG